MKLATLTTERLASSVPAASSESTVPVSSTYRSRMVYGPSRQVSGLSSSMAASSWRSLARVSAGTVVVRVRRSLSSPASVSVRSPRSTIRLMAAIAWLRSVRASRMTASTSRASRRHGPAVIIRTRAGSLVGSAMARRAWSRSRISGASKRERPPTTVYGMSSARRRSTMASRCLCLRYRMATLLQGLAEPLPVAARMASTMATASSSGPAQTRSSIGAPASRSVRRTLSGAKRVSLHAINRLAPSRTLRTDRKFCSMARWCGRPGAGPSGSCAGGRLKRASNSAKAAKLAPRKR